MGPGVGSPPPFACGGLGGVTAWAGRGLVLQCLQRACAPLQPTPPPAPSPSPPLFSCSPLNPFHTLLLFRSWRPQASTRCSSSCTPARRQPRPPASSRSVPPPTPLRHCTTPSAHCTTPSPSPTVPLSHCTTPSPSPTAPLSHCTAAHTRTVWVGRSVNLRSGLFPPLFLSFFLSWLPCSLGPLRLRLRGLRAACWPRLPCSPHTKPSAPPLPPLHAGGGA